MHEVEGMTRVKEIGSDQARMRGFFGPDPILPDLLGEDRREKT